MAIKIPIEGSFNQGDVKSQIAQINNQVKSLGKAVAEANKQKFEPISLRSKDDLAAFVRQTQQLLKLQTELKKRMQETGQGNKMPLAADWSKLYPNAAERNRKLQEVLGFYGADFEDLPAPGKPRRPRRKPRYHVPGESPGTGGGWKQTGADVVGAGLRATGSGGAVASRALGTGMSSGIGAGLAGLFGGLLALGISKAVGNVMSHVGTAEDNEVAYDTLKRTLGDVNVAFNSLKAVVKSTGDQYKVTYSESARLSTLYARQGNLQGSDYLTMGGEVGAGIGLSRSFGLTPESGVSALAGFRGLNVARNENEVRHFAVLIGETITKSGAFAKADEVLSAISNYTAQQTRQTLSQNVEGYAQQLSSLLSPRIPGLDVQGASNLLAQADASIKKGGSAGEASQFMLYNIGAGLGLNAFETRQLQEAGATGTLSSVFGPDSQAVRFGMKERAGDKTTLVRVLEQIRKQYAPHEKDQRGITAAATADALGLTMARAEALQQMQMTGGLNDLFKQLKGMGLDLKDVDTSALSAMGQVLSGSKDDRLKIAKELFERRDRTGKLVMSDDERSRLNSVMKSGDQERQTQVLLQLLAKFGQQETMGKDIRDSKALLDNIATGLAEKLIPYTQTARDALLALVGPDTGPRATQAKLAEARINEQYQSAIDEQKSVYEENMPMTLGDTYVSGDGPLSRRNKARMNKASDAWRKLEKLKSDRDNAIKERTKLIYSDLARPGIDNKPMLFGAEKDWRPTGSGKTVLPPYQPGKGYPANYGLGNYDISDMNRAFIRAFIDEESGGQQFDKHGNVKISSAGAVGIAQVLPSTGPEAAKLAGLPWNRDRFFNDPAYNKALGVAYMRKQIMDFGSLAKGAAAYNAGPGRLRKGLAMAKRDGVPGDWLSYMPAETRKYVAEIMGKYRAYNQQVPHPGQAGDAGGNGNMRITTDDLTVKVAVDGPGTATAPPFLRTRVERASPFPFPFVGAR